METGSFATIHLIDPVERHWGRLVKIMDAGVTFRGIPVKDIENFKYQLKSGERQIFPQTMFVPTRRLLKMDLDERIGDLPSVIDSFRSVTGLSDQEIIDL